MKIAVHAVNGMTMFHLAAPLLVFGEVSRLGLASGWQTSVWTQDGHGIHTAEGLRVAEVAGPEVVPGADIVVLPSWPAGLRPADDDLVQLVNRAHVDGSTVVGLCPGAFPVADSELLDGRGAVTHWAAAPLLQQRRTAVQVNASALYLDHGDVLTSAGTASGLDACLHVVRTRLGSAVANTVANTVARHLVVAPAGSDRSPEPHDAGSARQLAVGPSRCAPAASASAAPRAHAAVDLRRARCRDADRAPAELARPPAERLLLRRTPPGVHDAARTRSAAARGGPSRRWGTG